MRRKGAAPPAEGAGNWFDGVSTSMAETDKAGVMRQFRWRDGELEWEDIETVAKPARQKTVREKTSRPRTR